MSKANKRAIESGNFWDMRIAHNRLVSKPRVDADETKARHKKKRIRLLTERLIIKQLRFARGRYWWSERKQHRDKRQTKHNQIQYGFDIANWMMMQHA
ncbi:unnamed protein product [marine sediment metagenome]|uniref:Uncharacterized protein n=1 Tax=marine sediment metagenome TaxID=412755 RepID=X0SWR9_9ZZZZ